MRSLTSKFFSLFLAATFLVSLNLKAQSEEDPDLPSNLNNPISKEEFFLKREMHIGMLRGSEFAGRLNYNARGAAIEQKLFLERQQQQNPSYLSLTPNWVQLGPSPIPNGQTTPSVAVSGRVTSIAIHPTNPNLLYIGTANGGVYRSANGGTNWTPIFDAAESLAIGSLALAPSDPSILYVGTGEANLSADSYAGIGLYRIDNADAAATLNGPINPVMSGTTAFFGRSISKILVHPTDPAIIYVSTATGVIGNPNSTAGAGNIPPLGRRGIYRSTNATASTSSVAFTKIDITAASENISVLDMVMHPSNPDQITCYTHAAGGGIYQTQNASAATPAFTQYYTTTAAVRGELAIAPNGANPVMYCANGEGTSSQGKIMVSNDNGLSWAQVGGSFGFCGGQCFYDIAIEVDPVTPANVYVGGAAGSLIFRRSTNSAASFTSSTSSLHADVHTIKCAPSAPTTLYLGCDGGIFKSTNGGVSWTSMNTAGLHATQFQSIALHPIDPNFTIGGTQDNGTNMIQPAGTHTRLDGGDGGYTAIDQNATDNTTVTMYHTYYNNASQAGFARSTTVGGAWSFLGCGGTSNGIVCPGTTLFYAPLALGPGSPNTVYFATDRLYRSTNRGTTMTSVSQTPVVSGVAITSISIAKTDDNYRLIGLRNGTVYFTNSGSSTLVDITPTGAPTVTVGRVAIDPVNKNTAYVSYGGYGLAAGAHLYKTTDLDAVTPTWTISGNGIPDVPVNSLAIDPSNTMIMYAGTDIGVYVTIDAGVTWNSYSTGLPPVPVFDMAVHPITKTLRIATHGRGFWESTNAILPVTYSGFYATAKPNNKVLLEWHTATETNNRGFDIERSPYSADASGLSWEKIGFVQGSGTTTTPRRYSYEDLPVGGQKFVYRLRQLNIDGSARNSENRIVSLSGLDYALFNISPNPVKGSVQLKYRIPQREMVNITIYSTDGRHIRTLVNESKETGLYQANADMSNLPPGTYIYKMVAGSFYNSKRFIVL